MESIAFIIIKSSHCAEIGLQSIEEIGILPPSSSFPSYPSDFIIGNFRARSRSRAKACGYCVHIYIGTSLSSYRWWKEFPAV
jgi:hypothetical protein